MYSIRFTNGYVKTVAGFFAKRTIVTILVLIAIVIVTVFLGKHIAAGFVPEEDQGYFIVSAAQLPDAAITLTERTDKVTRKLEELLSKIPRDSTVARPSTGTTF